MNAILWVGQAMLAVTFLGSGAAKSIMSKPRLLETGQTGVAPFPPPVIRIVAALELVAAVAVIVPWLTGVATVLTPLAALGLAAVMVGAAMSHASLREPRNVLINAVLLMICVFVATGRFAGVAG